jgi:hypothetical protein
LSDATVVIMSESKSVSGNCHVAKKSQRSPKVRCRRKSRDGL